MSDSSQSIMQQAADRLKQGQSLEPQGKFDEAISLYDQAIALLRTMPVEDHPARRMLGVAWMNRGNALQQLGTPVSLGDAVKSYDEGIVVLQTLPLDTDPLYRNHLGAAYLNRGHALLMTQNPEGLTSFEEAIRQFEKLPLDKDPHFRLNLIGAWANLAHGSLGIEPLRAEAAAKAALTLLEGIERAHEAFAVMSLRARRALVMAIGEILRTNRQGERKPVDMISEATDAIDDGLALTRDLETQGAQQLRGLANRLFRLGAQIYGTHQPHFLGEFLVEQLAFPGFAADADFRAVADQALAQAITILQRPQMLVAGQADTSRTLSTVQALRAAQQQLAALPPVPTPPQPSPA